MKSEFPLALSEYYARMFVFYPDSYLFVWQVFQFPVGWVWFCIRSGRFTQFIRVCPPPPLAPFITCPKAKQNKFVRIIVLQVLSVFKRFFCIKHLGPWYKGTISSKKVSMSRSLQDNAESEFGRNPVGRYLVLKDITDFSNMKDFVILSKLR